jgi:hypothetical protein
MTLVLATPFLLGLDLLSQFPTVPLPLPPMR